ncbi:hypothetical protein D3C84_1307250 [compost metagenome]
MKNYRNSPIVYLQFGDGPATYQNESFRRILANAIRWACSPEAREWAREWAISQSKGGRCPFSEGRPVA